MQELLNLGKNLYDKEKEQNEIWKEIYLYLDSKKLFVNINNTPDFYLYLLLHDEVHNPLLEEDKIFLDKKKRYQELGFILHGYEEKIKEFNYAPKSKGRWLIYKLSNPYPDIYPELGATVSEYFVKCKKPKEFLKHYASYYYIYKNIQLLSKEEARTINEKIYKL